MKFTDMCSQERIILFLGFLHGKAFIVHFYGICQRQCYYEFNTVYQKSGNIFCSKPKEENHNNRTRFLYDIQMFRQHSNIQ